MHCKSVKCYYIHHRKPFLAKKSYYYLENGKVHQSNAEEDIKTKEVLDMTFSFRITKLMH